LLAETLATIEAYNFFLDSGDKGTYHHDEAQPCKCGPRNTRRHAVDVKPDASADTLADRLAEVKAEKVCKTLTDVNGAALL